MRQRVMNVGKPQTVCPMLSECQTQGGACRGRTLEKVANLFCKDFSAPSFLVSWVSSLLPGNRCFPSLVTQSGLWTSSISVIWEHVRNTDSQAPAQTCCIRTCIVTRSPVIPTQKWSLSCTALLRGFVIRGELWKVLAHHRSLVYVCGMAGWRENEWGQRGKCTITVTLPDPTSC